MRKVLMLVMMAGLLVGSLSARQKTLTEKELLKQRQKQEMRTFKTSERYQKQMMKNDQAPKAVRIQMKHQMQREARQLKEKQKDERQDLKDRQRLVRNAGE